MGWQRLVQKLIFTLLFVNACLLAAAIAPPLLGQSSPFDTAKAPLLDMSLPVEQDTTLLFGNMRFSAAEGLTLDQARLLINGEQAGHFGAGELTVRVYEGDVVTIDGSAYKRALLFHISAVSSNINSDLLPKSVSTDGDIAQLPIICFK